MSSVLDPEQPNNNLNVCLTLLLMLVFLNDVQK